MRIVWSSIKSFRSFASSGQPLLHKLTMKVFVVLAAVLACAYAKPQFITAYNGYLGAPAVAYNAPAVAYNAPVYSAPVYHAPAIVAPAFTKTQYHAQDELGQASYGYAHPGQASAAIRDAFGNVRGSYAYVDPNGKEVRVNYIADAGGFRVESNALPEAPGVPVTPALIAPEPVQDTPEVAEAKAAHAKAVEEAKVRNAEAEKAEAVESADPAPSRRKRGVAYTYAAPLSYGYSVAAAPALTYSVASPVVSAVHHPVAYSTIAAAPVVHAYAAPTVVAAAHPVREATLTKVVNTPGHAVSYRVD